jgi:hypothetical protein
MSVAVKLFPLVLLIIVLGFLPDLSGAEDFPNLPLCEKLNQHDGVSCSVFRFTRGATTTPSMRFQYDSVVTAEMVKSEAVGAAAEWCNEALNAGRPDLLVIMVFEKQVSMQVMACGDYVAK